MAQNRERVSRFCVELLILRAIPEWRTKICPCFTFHFFRNFAAKLRYRWRFHPVI